MQNPINTIPIQQFLQTVKSADLSQQKEIRLDIKTAKSLAYCIADLNARLLEDQDALLKKIQANNGSNISVQMDGGGFSNN